MSQITYDELKEKGKSPKSIGVQLTPGKPGDIVKSGYKHVVSNIAQLFVGGLDISFLRIRNVG
ncbi:MAG: hypothetical protein MJZ23_05220 [Paludibacteraceae bacterium]|nr:hypothetical protein [Paludibacteraceae bacterium]